jgi:hypothetical protein
MPVHPPHPCGHGLFPGVNRSEGPRHRHDAFPRPVCIRASGMLVLRITESHGRSFASGMAASRSRAHQARNVPPPLLEPERYQPCPRDPPRSPLASPPCAFVLAFMWGV